MISILSKNICNETLKIQQDAKNLISEFGDKASTEALTKMQDLMDSNDVKIAQYWLAVAHEIDMMKSSKVN